LRVSVAYQVLDFAYTTFSKNFEGKYEIGGKEVDDIIKIWFAPMLFVKLFRFLLVQSRHFKVGDGKALFLDEVNDLAYIEVGIRGN
jgi:hypothetical protein